MTPHDLAPFGEMFDDLCAMFKFYGTGDQKAAALASYFQTMQRFPLDRVRLGYEKLKETAQKWPVPAQWIAAMPRMEGGDLPDMTRQQMHESDEAERRFYEGDLCNCRECVEASATHLPTRYVPRLDANGEVVKLRHPFKQTPTVIGEWIHGYRLKRWWAAKAEFYQTLAKLKPGVKRELETPVGVTGPEAR